jgi:Holliday junction resolvasome RuvABC endonuclease subunit
MQRGWKHERKKKEEEEAEYTQEQVQEMLKEIMECDYYPKEITQKDMEDYLAKEKSGETWRDGIEHQEENMKRGEAFLVQQIEKRINENAEMGIVPNEETKRAANEEVVIYRIKQFADAVKEMKEEFQVEKFRLINTFNNKEVLKTYTDEQIKNTVLSMLKVKRGIETNEKELREWEQEAKQRYGGGEEEEGKSD